MPKMWNELATLCLHSVVFVFKVVMSLLSVVQQRTGPKSAD